MHTSKTSSIVKHTLADCWEDHCFSRKANQPHSTLAEKKEEEEEEDFDRLKISQQRFRDL